MATTEATILSALCVTCGYASDNAFTVEVWNDYGDHGHTDDRDDHDDDASETLWVLSDGTIAHVVDSPDQHQHTVLTGEDADAARIKVNAALTARHGQRS